jgi:two-component system, cell cycle sensor histidine kinase and response regulator CckA
VSRSGVSRRKPDPARTPPDVASLYRTLARNFPDGSLVLFDRDLRYIVAGGDEGWVAGLAPVGCEGKAVRDVLPPEVAQALEPLYRGALAGRRAAAEVAYQDRWLLVRAGPVRDDAGTIVAGMSLSQDISDAKQALRGSRDLLQEIIESSSDAIVAKDLEGRYVLINSSGARLLGRPAGEIVGRDDAALFPADQAARSREADARVRSRGESETAEEHVVVEGRRRTLLLTRSPLRDHDGRIIGVLGLARDVTEQRQLEERLSRAHRMESVARLAGGIAHDFNNLLTVILGSAEILLDDLPRAYARRNDLDEIKRAATQAAQLTRQVLAYSRQQVLAPRLLDLNRLVAGMERAVRPLLGGRIELALDLGAQSGAVRVDPGQLEQAVLNLVMNARDAMPGGGRLEVATRTVVVDEVFARQHPPMRPGRYTTLAVRDTGVGMDEDTQGHLFEPFFTTKPGRHGAGLGLATTYGIVKQSGGYIWSESAPGAGATFTIYLPWHEPLVAAAVPAAESPAAARGAGETVLVVDDEPAVRVVTKRILQRSGYAVLDAAGGAEALDTLREHPGPIHLLLTDVIMPEMNGREVARRVRDQRPGIRVVYMSAYSPEAIAHDGLVDEGAAFVRKPFESGLLLQTVRRALDTMGHATPA